MNDSSKNDSKCPCGSGKALAACCGPYLAGDAKAPTAKALMRSRYTAYVLGDIEHLVNTVVPEKQGAFDREAAMAWSEGATWRGLEILETQGGGEDDREGLVDFIARFDMKGEPREHRELAVFEKQDDTWYYVSGKVPAREPYVREAKVGRNEPCPCGSGKKYKKCCGR